MTHISLILGGTKQDKLCDLEESIDSSKEWFLVLSNLFVLYCLISF